MWRVALFLLIFFGPLAADNIEGNALLLPAVPREEITRTIIHQRRSALWSEDYPATVREAKANEKVIMVAFMGSGWCPWSEKFEREILNDIHFTEQLKDEVNFVWLSCPRESARANVDIRQLKERFGIDEFPTLVFINSQEEELFRVGYLPLSSHEFAAKLRQMIRDYLALWSRVEKKGSEPFALDELKSLYQKASSLNSYHYKERLMQMGLAEDRGTFFLLEKYAELAESGEKTESAELKQKIIERDPKNLAGSQLSLAILDFQTKSALLKNRENVKSVIKPLVEYIQRFGKRDRENLWKVQMMLAQYLFSKNAIPDALAHAAASYKSAPEEKKAEIAQTIDYLKTQVQ